MDWRRMVRPGPGVRRMLQRRPPPVPAWLRRAPPFAEWLRRPLTGAPPPARPGAALAHRIAAGAGHGSDAIRNAVSRTVGHVRPRHRLRRLSRRARVRSERALRAWERYPARTRQRVTIGIGLGLAALVIVLLALVFWPRPAPVPAPRYSPISLDALPGWHTDSVTEARPAFALSCDKLATLPADRPMAVQGHEALRAITGPVGDWQAACARLAAVPDDDPAAFRTFLMRTFQAFAVSSSDRQADGLFTGYYEAHINAARTRGGVYQTPVYGPPTDLVMEAGQGHRRVDGTLQPYHDRAAIEDGAIAETAPVLFWAADPVDLHILHIQGSGQVTLPDGSGTRIGYAANNGQPFVGIGRLVRERGLADGGSMPAIREWLRDNPEQGADLMRENPRYIFFREIAGDGPIGAFGVPLTPLRSLAVDPAVLPLGALVWLDTTDPDGLPLRRLMAAQDVGSAIKGINRGDVFWGSGEAAFQKAGRMASPGRTYLFVPRPLRGPDPLLM